MTLGVSGKVPLFLWQLPVGLSLSGFGTPNTGFGFLEEKQTRPSDKVVMRMVQSRAV